jgi:hypothetical protein
MCSPACFVENIVRDRLSTAHQAPARLPLWPIEKILKATSNSWFLLNAEAEKGSNYRSLFCWVCVEFRARPLRCMTNEVAFFPPSSLALVVVGQK